MAVAHSPEGSGQVKSLVVIYGVQELLPQSFCAGVLGQVQQVEAGVSDR